MAKVKLHAHPCLNKSSQPNPGIYMDHKYHCLNKYRTQQGKQEFIQPSLVSVNDTYRDPHKRLGKVPDRFLGKQFLTNPPRNMTCWGIYPPAPGLKNPRQLGAGGYFDCLAVNKMKNKDGSLAPRPTDKYTENQAYVQRFPLDKRKLGFGTQDAPKRDEFMTFVRTAQYREQLKAEKRILDEIDKTNKENTPNDVSGTRKGDDSSQKKSFPAGLKECKHLYDIGRAGKNGLVTNFDQQSSRDTFYNPLMCKSRIRGERRTGGAWLSSTECGDGIAQLDHSQFKAGHGHIRATKAFFDRSHLGQSALQ